MVNDLTKQDTDMLTLSLSLFRVSFLNLGIRGVSSSASEAVQVRKISAAELLVRQSHHHHHVPLELGLPQTSSSLDPRRECHSLGAGVC